MVRGRYHRLPRDAEARTACGVSGGASSNLAPFPVLDSLTNLYRIADHTLPTIHTLLALKTYTFQTLPP